MYYSRGSLVDWELLLSHFGMRMHEVPVPVDELAEQLVHLAEECAEPRLEVPVACQREEVWQGSTRLSMGTRRQAMVREAARSVMSSCGSACPVNA